MGFVKRQMMDEESRGWRDGPSQNVCSDCADDDYLGEAIRGSLDATECDYCGSSSGDQTPIAAPVNVLIELVAQAVYTYWTDPAEELPFETAEGGYQGEVIDTRDLLANHIGMEWPESLLDDVADALVNEHWCKRHYFSLEPNARLKLGWEDFARLTKHRDRYTALLPPLSDNSLDDPDSLHPSEMMRRVARFFKRLGLIRPLPPGAFLFRARTHAASETLSTAAELGAPTYEQAKHANRMSAAGIPVFYGALDEGTAVAETFRSGNADHVATVGAFRTVRALNVLDLTQIPAVPSYFDTARKGSRVATIFLRDFVKAVSLATTKDGREHIDYVPTQIFAEYVRNRVRAQGGEPVHGIFYPSAQAKGVCCVLFCDQAACLPRTPGSWRPHEQWVSLVGNPSRWDNDRCKAVLP